jgi:hypothetical protein
MMQSWVVRRPWNRQLRPRFFLAALLQAVKALVTLASTDDRQICDRRRKGESVSSYAGQLIVVRRLRNRSLPIYFH